MALESIRGSLKDKGVRLTRQRQILLDLIDKSGQHLDAENLFQMAKEKDPKLNRVTVYRTLKLLKEGGLVDELFGDPLQRLRRQIEAHFGFQIVLARTEVGGYCSHCQVLRAQEIEEAREQSPNGLPHAPFRQRTGKLKDDPRAR